MTSNTIPKELDADEIARISAALIAAIAEAQTLAADGTIGDEFRELLRHSREMHDLMVEQLQQASESSAVEYARGLVESMGNHLDELEAALKRDLN